MKMASTFTQTATKTFTRLELIKTQVRIALRRTTNISIETLQNTFDRGLDNRWIAKIIICGVDSKNYCRAQLILEIDWDKYDLQLARGKATIAIDGRWKDDSAIELDEIVALFNKCVSEYSLTTKLQTRHPKGLSDEVYRKLGLVDAEPITWQRGWSSQIPELPELRVGCYIAED
jgi:hypothetical protein